MSKFIAMMIGLFALMFAIVAIDVAWRMFIAMAVGRAWGIL